MKVEKVVAKVDKEIKPAVIVKKEIHKPAEIKKDIPKSELKEVEKEEKRNK